MTLTLKDIRDQSPCESGWRKLTKALGTIDPATELSIGDVVIANGLDDALWCLRCISPRERVAAILPAVRRVSVHTDDQRVHNCIAAVDRWLAGTAVDLDTARAAGDAAWAAWDAAWAAWDVARDAAGAAREAAGAAARAAGDAARAAGDAARAAARAAGDAAREAAWGAREAAREAAWGAERNQQRDDLLSMFPPIKLKETK